MSRNLSEEELTPHTFVARSGDNDVWCRDCEYHQDHPIHAASDASSDTQPWQEFRALVVQWSQDVRFGATYVERGRTGVRTAYETLQRVLIEMDKLALPAHQERTEPPTAAREFETLARFETPEYQQRDWEGQPPSTKAIEAARKFLRYAWAVAPCMDGGVQLERHHNGCDMEITFDADGQCESVYAELANGAPARAAEWQPRLTKFLARLAEMKTCNEEPGECYLDSGPYCGMHDFYIDADNICEARELLKLLPPCALTGTTKDDDAR